MGEGKYVWNIWKRGTGYKIKIIFTREGVRNHMTLKQASKIIEKVLKENWSKKKAMENKR